MSSTILMRGIPFDAQETYNSNTGETEYDRVAYSADVADWFDTMFSTGIVIPGGGTFTTELKVESQSGMHVKINPGRAVINGRLGYIEEAQVLDLDDPSTSNRIDRIVVELNLTERNFYVKVLKGTPSSSPVAVAPTKTDTIYQLVLADVLVTANVSGTANITDQRNNAELCGISNVRVGVYVPPSDSSENIEVSGDTSDELGGATNVNEALKNVYQVGDIRATMRKDLSDKWLECNGDVVTKTDYPDLAALGNDITQYINVYELTAEKMPSDLDFSGGGYQSSIRDVYIYPFIQSVFKYGTSGIGLLVAWSNKNTYPNMGHAAYTILYYLNSVTEPINSLNDLNYTNTIFSNKVSDIRGKWLNNRFLIIDSRMVDSLTTRGNLGVVYSVSGSTLSKTSSFIKSPLTLYRSASAVNDELRSYEFIDVAYANGAYKFLYTYRDTNTVSDGWTKMAVISMSSFSTSGNSYSSISNIDDSTHALEYYDSATIGSTIIFFEQSVDYYESTSIFMVDLSTSTIILEENFSVESTTIDSNVYWLLSLNPDEMYISMFVSNKYTRLLKFTASKAYLLTGSGWTDISTISDLNTEFGDTNYQTSSTPKGGVVNGDEFVLFIGTKGYTIKESELASKFNKNWTDNFPVTCVLSKSLNRMNSDESYLKIDGNLYSISSRYRSTSTDAGNFKNYDNAIKLPELTADDVSAYYVKVKE